MTGIDFTRVSDDVQSLVDAIAASSGSTIERTTDEYGYEWVIVRDPDIEDLVGGVHTVASELTAQGFGPQLLAAAFRFEDGDRPVYWIYGFKLGTFWPFIPLDEHKRDNAKELELKAKLEKELAGLPERSEGPEPGVPGDRPSGNWARYGNGPAFLQHLSAGESPKAVLSALQGSGAAGWPRPLA